ncbi:hypothetical protein BJ875DRAFT_486016 [Amylocarpus encephaloides]|uniref:Uncharacterized protein n=1 Tax=Amylocarpus encephaloides TaxID=45428 RepID=A0A9P7YF17_9HELO|nr:hypothetical protein BJ875DRAFT_486016 [Amylocarpus encephaloides]
MVAVALKSIHGFFFGGSSCSDDLGDKPVNASVYVVSHHGAIVMGQLMISYREKNGKAWNYVRPLPSIAPFLSMSPKEMALTSVFVSTDFQTRSPRIAQILPTLFAPVTHSYDIQQFQIRGSTSAGSMIEGL